MPIPELELLRYPLLLGQLACDREHPWARIEPDHPPAGPDPATHFARDNTCPAANIEDMLAELDSEDVKVRVTDGYLVVRLATRLLEPRQLTHPGSLSAPAGKSHGTCEVVPPSAMSRFECFELPLAINLPREPPWLPQEKPS